MTQRSTPRRRQQRAVGYVRRSTDRQEQSIPDQKKAIEAYVLEHGLRLGKHYIDDAISGTSTIGRRAFQQMMQDAQRPTRAFDLIIVYDIKRFGRVDNDEAGYYRHVLRTHGVEVRYVSENFNGDATDDLLRPVKQWQARQESKDLSKVTIRGLLSKFDAGSAGGKSGGWWMGGVPPHGYDLRYESISGVSLFTVRYLQDGTKQVFNAKGQVERTLARGESLNISKRDRAKLVPGDRGRAEVIRRIFKMYGDHGKGYKSIAQTLNTDNVPTARGPEWSHIYSGKWTDTTIRSILVNPVYAGDLVWNRRTDGRFHQIKNGRAVERESVHGARLVPNDESDWIVVRDAHEPLVSRRVFEQAKQRRESQPSSIEQRGRNSRLKTHGRTWSGKRSRFILSGLLTCARCGNRYQGVTRCKGKRRTDGTRVKTMTYACGGYITKGTNVCTWNSIPQSDLEESVINAVLAFYRPYVAKGGKRKLAIAVKDALGSEDDQVAQARERAEAEQERITDIINNLLDNMTSTNRAHVDKRLKELTAQRQQLESRLDEFDRLTTTQAEINATVTDALQLLSSLEFTLRQGLPQEQLTALRQCVVRVRIGAPDSAMKITLLTVPAGGVTAVQTVEIERPLNAGTPPAKSVSH
jgi:site-specific DNA recombinase